MQIPGGCFLSVGHKQNWAVQADRHVPQRPPVSRFSLCFSTPEPGTLPVAGRRSSCAARSLSGTAAHPFLPPGKSPSLCRGALPSLRTSSRQSCQALHAKRLLGTKVLAELTAPSVKLFLPSCDHGQQRWYQTTSTVKKSPSAAPILSSRFSSDFVELSACSDRTSSTTRPLRAERIPCCSQQITVTGPTAGGSAGPRARNKQPSPGRGNAPSATAFPLRQAELTEERVCPSLTWFNSLDSSSPETSLK